jgi:hypothetical protein
MDTPQQYWKTLEKKNNQKAESSRIQVAFLYTHVKHDCAAKQPNQNGSSAT